MDIKSVSVWCCLNILSSTLATSDAQLMKKQHQGWVKKKALLIKNGL